MSEGKYAVLVECFDKDGNSVIAMMSNPITVYRRRNGTYFIKLEGVRHNVEKLDGGTFYQKRVVR